MPFVRAPVRRGPVVAGRVGADRGAAFLAAVLVGASCSSSPAAVPAPPATAPDPPRRFGDLMAEVGRRFERAGRASGVGSWELAEYDVHEIEEVFEDDVPTARIPHDVTADVRTIGAAFASGPLETLHDAARSRDEAGFAAAFAAAAEACNACHRAAEHGFIVVPTTPGSAVPVVGELVPSAASGE